MAVTSIVEEQIPAIRKEQELQKTDFDTLKAVVERHERLIVAGAGAGPCAPGGSERPAAVQSHAPLSPHQRRSPPKAFLPEKLMLFKIPNYKLDELSTSFNQYHCALEPSLRELLRPPIIKIGLNSNLPWGQWKVKYGSDVTEVQRKLSEEIERRPIPSPSGAFTCDVVIEEEPEKRIPHNLARQAKALLLADGSCGNKQLTVRGGQVLVDDLPVGAYDGQARRWRWREGLLRRVAPGIKIEDVEVFNDSAL